MEEITINNIEKKDSGLVIVGYNGDKEATMNTKWQAQEVDYFEKDVGIGGKVKCLIVPKGDYINITKVDFASAVKGEVITTPSPVVDGHVCGLLSPKDVSIIAQCMTKCACYGRNDVTIDKALEMYHEAVLSLEQNG